MSVVASFVGGWGHAEPLLDVARSAQAHGHHVTFAGQRAVLPRLSAIGFDTIEVGPDTLSTERTALQPIDREMERAVMRDHFVSGFGRQRATSMTELLRAASPHLVVCDEVDVGSIVAAELLGIPVVTVNVVMAGRLLSPSNIGAAWSGLRVDVGLEPDDDGVRLGGDLMLAPLPPSLRDPGLPTPRGWSPVRPPALDFPMIPKRVGEPFVYATLGTVFNVESGDLLDRLIAGLGILDADALVTVGPNIDPAANSDEFAGRSPRVRIEQFVAQRDVLGRCDAVVCHGGSGTLSAALSLGIPVVVIPMGADQPDNADRCADLGCGIVLDPIAATPSTIAAAVRRVLDDPAFRTSAERLANEARSQPPLDQLAPLLDLLRR